MNKIKKYIRLYLITNLIGFTFLSSLSFAQASKEELAAITQRGKMLFEYDIAAWSATDAVMSTNPDKTLVEQYIAQKIGDQWEVVFGKMNKEKTAFVINYKVKNEIDISNEQQIPYDDQDYYFNAVLALEAAMKDFDKNNTYDRPFNVAVLPKDQNLYVYIYPAPIKEGIFPLGGDWRYLISSENHNILEKRQLHKTILESDTPPPKTIQSSYHVAVLDEIPEDTDVFHVLLRKPSVPELVLTRDYVYKIEVDGTIKYLGLVKDV